MERFFKILACLAVIAAMSAIAATQTLQYLYPVGQYQIVADSVSAYVLETTSGYAEYFVFDGNDFQYKGQLQIGAGERDDSTETSVPRHGGKGTSISARARLALADRLRPGGR